MENINKYTKQLVIGEDERSWVFHSPNVVVGRKSSIFENSEFVRGNIDYSKVIAERKQSHEERSSGVLPRSTLERIRMYE